MVTPFPSINPVFHNETAARTAMEALRWPDGPVCPHCQERIRLIEIAGAKRSHRAGLRHCTSCRKQFSVTVGTPLAGTRVSLVNWMRLAYLLSQIDVTSIRVPDITSALDIPYKTAVRMLDRVSNVLITYKGRLSGKKFGKVITHYVTGKARPPQPRLRFPKHPSNPRNRAEVARRYTAWRERLGLIDSATPEPIGALVAQNGDPSASRKTLDRLERLVVVLLQADQTKVKAARKLRAEWEINRSRLHVARIRLPNRRSPCTKPSSKTTQRTPRD